MQIERLNQATHHVQDILRHVDNCELEAAQQMVLELLVLLEYRGVITMLGLRTTTGSMNVLWPSKSKL